MTASPAGRPAPSFEVGVDPAVHGAHPDYVALVLLASGLANGPSDAGSDAQLAAAEAHLRASGLERAVSAGMTVTLLGGRVAERQTRRP